MKRLMINKDFSYVAVDFETTGLDKKKDEPIQIGIVKCDASGNVTDAYVSYIKPTKNIKDLRQQVTLITGLSLDDVKDAPEREVVYDEIKKYFDEKSILIGHNIQFDISFLKKYWEDFKCAGSVDTYPLSQAIVHFYKSYALEAVTQAVYKDEAYQTIYKRIKTEVESLSPMKAHDALYDSVQSAAFFFWTMERITKLAALYPSFAGCTKKAEGIFGEILKPLHDVFEGETIKFPLMERPIYSGPKPKDNELFMPTGTDNKAYIGNIGFKKFLAEAAKKKVLISFSHRSKLDIAKNILNDLGHKGCSFLKEDQFIDPKQFERRLNKKTLNESEFLFCVKYISQLEKGYGIIDIKSQTDRSILNAIKKIMPYTPSNIVLSTHGGLYALMEGKIGLGKEWLKDYTIVYCDVERWYTSYNRFANSPFDLYRLLELLETYSYKYSFRAETMKDVGSKESSKLLESAVQSMSIFIGIFFDELTESFKGVSHSKINVDPILGQPQYFRTTKLWEQLTVKVESTYALLSEREKNALKSNFDKLDSLLNSLVKVDRRLANNTILYYTMAHDVNFTDYSEFLEIFKGENLMLSSHTADNYPHLQKDELEVDIEIEKRKKGVPMITLNDKSDIIMYTNKRKEKYKTDPKFFILSSKKHISKSMLDYLYKQGYHRDYDLLVENITGGIGKNTMRAGKPGAKIIIGGYHFLLNLFSNKQKIDICFILNIDGPLKNQILHDITWYGGPVSG